MISQTDYVLGTHDDEIARLGLQHRAWLPRVRETWELAGIGPGHTVLDLGCGPGYAALDLAALAGPSGRVVAIDKSTRFLSALEAECRRREIGNVQTIRADLDHGELPVVAVDCCWCRWVLSFLRNPSGVLEWLPCALRPGGMVVFHEYFDYGTWRATPRSPELDEFVQAVMASWRDAGGEPDIALSIPAWLENLGFRIHCIRPIITVVQPGEICWDWLRAFVDVGRRGLVEKGNLSATQAERIWQAFERLEEAPGARMVTPGVLEIVAGRS